jgi:spore germination cell wall hydrolase CwlJ-like protein
MAFLDSARRDAPAADDGFFVAPFGPQHLPPVRRFPPRVLLPGIVAAVFLAVLICIAVRSLRQPVGGDAESGRTASRTLSLAKKARIEAPFAPATLRPLSPEQALEWNAARPTTTTTADAASAFLLRSGAASDYQRSLQCLTMAIYYEAGNESDDGQRAVAQVVLNRLRHPAYPKTVCGVVMDGAQRRTGCQFTFACDGALARVPSTTGWNRAAGAAASALGGAVFAPVGWATHYHANYVVPYWAASLDKITAIGAHIFYRWSGVAGQRAAFRGVYAGNEPALAVANTLAPGTASTADAPPAGTAAPVPSAERPVLTGTRPIGDDAPSTTIGLGERRILLRAPDVGTANGQ